MKLILFVLTTIVSCASFAQTATVSGKVTDNGANQPVVGAKIIFSDAYKAYSDYDGNYTIENVPFGEYNATITMLSFDTISVTIKVDSENFTYDVLMGGSQEIEEMEVIGNIAQDRKTPVAVTTLGKKKLAEELGSQDLPMILNSTPGVHATQTGGGDGDARITIRGFDQRNVGTMIDGVPVNDMENGWVYWSNWFGLDAITSQIQVQRGLGATKLAMPSVGGTMNILTDNAGGTRQIKVRQEYGTGNFFRTSISYKSGTLKHGWGILFSGSYKQGDGWVDGLSTQGGFYYLKIQKKFGNHVLSLSGFGAPQKHGQRSYNQQIEYWDSEYARKLGVTQFDSTNIDRGLRYNQHWGWKTDDAGKKSVMNERLNYYHKPQVTLKDFWKINNKLSWSNIAYMSIGRGGGQRYFNSSSTIIRDDEGLVDWNEIEYNNQWKTLFGTVYSTADVAYDPDLLKSSQILSASVNNHMWIGGLSQFDYKMNDRFTLAGGVDYRWYKGTHYTEVVDLLGGDYFINESDLNAPTTMKVVGDKIAREDRPYQNHRDGYVQWAGGFIQAEYSDTRWTAFLNVSGVTNGYRGVDHFQKRTMQVGDSLIEIGYADTVVLDGQTYTRGSDGLENSDTGWKWLAGATIKAGANFNMTERSNIFMNLGYLNRTPQFSNVVDNNTNDFFVEILNEKIYAAELGYGFRSKKVSLNANGYFTYWENKPFPFGVSVPDPLDPTEFVRANVNGMDALHMGIEVDVSYRVLNTLTVEAMASIGDWTWQSSEIIDVLGTEFEFDAKGVHVGDAAQSTYALSARWAFVKNGYLKVKYTYFDRYYANFDPFSLTGANGGRESWRIPGYGLMSIHAGYRLKIKKSSLNFRANVFNVLNSMYISDARTNQFGTDFTTNSVGVFVGQGIRFNVSLGFEF
ncbi:MAG: TonB-dependent receptor plug domain-containing protein [Crocinitomicaceae bacterium]|nr:TonB-dependent receptor plug domain-containing protein [Crocinitomicaceae bacterium]